MGCSFLRQGSIPKLKYDFFPNNQKKDGKTGKDNNPINL